MQVVANSPVPNMPTTKSYDSKSRDLNLGISTKALIGFGVGASLSKAQDMHKENNFYKAADKCSLFPLSYDLTAEFKSHRMMQNSTAEHISKENGNTNSKRHLHCNVHSSTISNSQDMEATQGPTER